MRVFHALALLLLLLKVGCCCCCCHFRVLDECDEMLNMGFVDDVEKILNAGGHTAKALSTNSSFCLCVCC
jgi:hypothetical protein